MHLARASRLYRAAPGTRLSQGLGRGSERSVAVPSRRWAGTRYAVPSWPGTRTSVGLTRPSATVAGVLVPGRTAWMITGTLPVVRSDQADKGESMIDTLVQQFAGGGAAQMEGSSLFGGVSQMLEGAQNEHGIGAISQALGSLGGQGFGQSVAQGAAQAGPGQRNGLADLLLKAVSQGADRHRACFPSSASGGKHGA